MESESRFFALEGCSEQTLDTSIKGYEFGIKDILCLERIRYDLEGSVKFGRDRVIDPDGGGNYVDGLSGLITGYYRLSNGVPVLWFGAGGNDEIPVAACAYVGLDRSVHIYVPFGGNVFDRMSMRAYKRGEMSMSDVRYDSDKLFSDASSHIVPKRADFWDGISIRIGNDTDFMRNPFSAVPPWHLGAAPFEAVPRYVCGDFALSPDAGGSACTAGMGMDTDLRADPGSPVSAGASADIPSQACPGGRSIEITPEQREELMRIIGQPLTADTAARAGLQVQEFPF
jgi:hypothetical protein